MDEERKKALCEAMEKDGITFPDLPGPVVEAFGDLSKWVMDYGKTGPGRKADMIDALYVAAAMQVCAGAGAGGDRDTALALFLTLCDMFEKPVGQVDAHITAQEILNEARK